MKVINPTNIRGTIILEYSGTENLTQYGGIHLKQENSISISKSILINNINENFAFVLNIRGNLNCLISLSSGNVYFYQTYNNWDHAFEHQKLISKEVNLDQEKPVIRGEFIFIEDINGDPYSRESYKFEIVLDKIEKDFKEFMKPTS